MATRVIPMGNRVFLRVDKEEDKTTASGLIVKRPLGEQFRYAEVAAVGEGLKSDKGELIPVGVEVGDRVLLSRYGGLEVEIDDEIYVVVPDGEIWAKI